MRLRSWSAVTRRALCWQTRSKASIGERDRRFIRAALAQKYWPMFRRRSGACWGFKSTRGTGDRLSCVGVTDLYYVPGIFGVPGIFSDGCECASRKFLSSWADLPAGLVQILIQQAAETKAISPTLQVRADRT